MPRPQLHVHIHTAAHACTEPSYPALFVDGHVVQRRARASLLHIHGKIVIETIVDLFVDICAGLPQKVPRISILELNKCIIIFFADLSGLIEDPKHLSVLVLYLCDHFDDLGGLELIHNLGSEIRNLGEGLAEA